MEIKNTEKKTFNSFDKNHFINTNYIRPSKFKELESISKLENNLINMFDVEIHHCYVVVI